MKLGKQSMHTPSPRSPTPPLPQPPMQLIKQLTLVEETCNCLIKQLALVEEPWESRSQSNSIFQRSL